MFLTAPTEPDALRALGTTSAIPERHGCDVAWPTAIGGFAGVQRKELTDLWASLQDGRLARSVAAMSGLVLRVLVVEGRLRWSSSGRLVTARTPLSRDQLRGLVLSLQQRGVSVVHTDDVADTVAAVVHIRRWQDERRHSSLDVRPRGPSSAASGRAWGIHLLQSFPTVGPTVAASLYDHFGGVPLAWTRSADELALVRGVGPVRAASLTAALPAELERSPTLRA